MKHYFKGESMRRHLLSIAFFSIFSMIFSSSCFAGQSQELTVSAAISLKNAFEEAGKIYESRNTGVRVLFNFGASGDLIRQIEGGAPVDVFASAAQRDMDEISGKGLIVSASRQEFAYNSLVLVVPVNSTIRIKSFADLGSSAINRIAAGNFRSVPAGRYAEEVFNYYRLMPGIKNKLIFAENVRQVLDYVARGEVDAGLVYATDARTRAKDVRVVGTAPAGSHKPVVYPIAVIKGTQNETAANGFISFLRSAEGKKILEKYGFKVP
jgi:molybdate transport system substrate-binding protein